MKPNLKTLAAILALGLIGYAAYAENVTISTFYPSPYGSYQTLETTGATTLATGAATTVLIGTNTAPPSGVKMHVQGGAIGTATAGGPTAYMEGTDSEARFGASLSNVAPVWIGNKQHPDTLVVNGTSQNVIITGSAQVTNSLTLKDTATPNNNTGVLQTICSGGNCYAVAVYS